MMKKLILGTAAIFFVSSFAFAADNATVTSDPVLQSTTTEQPIQTIQLSEADSVATQPTTTTTTTTTTADADKAAAPEASQPAKKHASHKRAHHGKRHHRHHHRANYKN